MEIEKLNSVINQLEADMLRLKRQCVGHLHRKGWSGMEWNRRPGAPAVPQSRYCCSALLGLQARGASAAAVVMTLVLALLLALPTLAAEDRNQESL